MGREEAADGVAFAEPTLKLYNRAGLELRDGNIGRHPASGQFGFRSTRCAG
jgi:hypothetical protein